MIVLRYQMSKKHKLVEDEMWINPNSTLKDSSRGEKRWDGSFTGIRTDARLLELADIALGNKKPRVNERNGSAGAHNLDPKTEPYSN